MQRLQMLLQLRIKVEETLIANGDALKMAPVPKEVLEILRGIDCGLTLLERLDKEIDRGVKGP